jgi:hypothetical protein
VSKNDWLIKRATLGNRNFGKSQLWEIATSVQEKRSTEVSILKLQKFRFYRSFFFFKANHFLPRRKSQLWEIATLGNRNFGNLKKKLTTPIGSVPKLLFL